MKYLGWVALVVLVVMAACASIPSPRIGENVDRYIERAKKANPTIRASVSGESKQFIHYMLTVQIYQVIYNKPEALAVIADKGTREVVSYGRSP